MIGFFLGLAGGFLAYACLSRWIKALLAGDSMAMLIYVALNMLSIFAALLICAFLRPTDLPWAGGALVGALLLAAIAQFLRTHFAEKAKTQNKKNDAASDDGRDETKD